MERQLRDGIVVEPSSAPSGAPVLMEWFSVLDFTETNKYVVTNPFPLPTIQTILSSVGGAQYFARLGVWDIDSFRFTLMIAINFQVQNRVFQYCRTVMGHVDSSFHVHREMDNAFSEHIGKGVFIYLDDIIIYASDFDQFLSLTSVFIILRARGLRYRGNTHL